MLVELIQLKKKILLEHYERLKRTNLPLKYLHLQFLWHYIHSDKYFSEECNSLKEKSKHHDFGAHQLVWTREYWPLPEDYTDRMYFIYQVLFKIIDRKQEGCVMSKVALKFSPSPEGFDHMTMFQQFNDLFLEPFVLHLINTNQKDQIILATLKNYKYRTEWFNKLQLQKTVDENSSKAEELLKMDLYKYFFDNGVEFHIEPVSPAGEIDLIASQKNSSEKLLIEGKIFDTKSRTQSYIKKGFDQLVTYVKEYGENKGFLIIYNISQKSLIINSPVYMPGIYSRTINNRTVYIAVIDLYHHEKSASKRDKLDLVEIEFSQLNYMLIMKIREDFIMNPTK